MSPDAIGSEEEGHDPDDRVVSRRSRIPRAGRPCRRRLLDWQGTGPGAAHRGLGSAVHQRVVATANVLVGATGRADRSGVAAEEEALTLVAPAPVALGRRAPGVEDQLVIAADALVVLPARRADRAGDTAEEEALAF